VQDETELIGAGAAAGGAVGGELGLVQLDEVLGLAARAIVVEVLGRTLEGGDDVARIEAAGGGFAPGDARRGLAQLLPA
jgi:hypothetical protein